MKNRRVAVRAIIAQDNTLLCVKLKKYGGNISDDGEDYWCTPGGGVDIGEPLVTALERELVEELGVKPDIGRLLYIQQFEYKDTEHLEFFFHVRNASDYQTIDLTNTTHGAIEIARVKFIDTNNETVLPSFLAGRDFVQDIAHSVVTVLNNLHA